MGIDPVLYRTPPVDPATNLIAREWLRYIESLTSRIATLEAALAAGITQTIVLASTTSIDVVEGVVT